MLQTCIQELSGRSLGWDTKCLEVPHAFINPLKFQDNISIRPWPLLSKSFTHHQLSYHQHYAVCINLLTPKDSYSGRTTLLTSKHCILCIYSTNTGTEYFKHGIYCPFFSLQNAVCFIILTYLVPVLFIFYIQGVLKFKKNNSGAKWLITAP